MSDNRQKWLRELTADLVSAFVTKNPVHPDQLTRLVEDVHSTLDELSTKTRTATGKAEPAVPPSKSITSDFLICLEDGRKLTMLKRYLRNRYGLSPEEYREKWGLPSDYPMVAPNYAAKRSEFAKKIGLGRRQEQDS